MPIKDNLKNIRASREMTQKELAKLAGIELAQVSRIERGTANPKVETIKNLAKALRCTTDSLIFDEEEREISERMRSVLSSIEELTPVSQHAILKVIKSYCEYETMHIKMVKSHLDEKMLWADIDPEDRELTHEEVVEIYHLERDKDHEEKRELEKLASN